MSLNGVEHNGRGFEYDPKPISIFWYFQIIFLRLCNPKKIVFSRCYFHKKHSPFTTWLNNVQFILYKKCRAEITNTGYFDYFYIVLWFLWYRMKRNFNVIQWCFLVCKLFFEIFKFINDRVSSFVVVVWKPTVMCCGRSFARAL